MSNMAQLSGPQRQKIEAEIYAGRTIGAIKLYRAALGGELVDAKKAIEDMEVDLRRQHPENFRASAKTGCLGMAACVALFVAMATLLSLF
jgi:ribosomal protein L7/L12